ncbi:MAG: WD40/YVTN/BNR-like repeat-containing protein, partial [Candidatus Loosdrechtia sp.]|uniref:WD40/YVTN/BNR-like repeat-containing protein n=1 Tax=Candidatus Loosdrechtia sp. TaxID=3101272 RepID=UPI00403AD8B7
MKPAMNLLGIVVLIFCQIVLFNIQVSADEQGYRHFYGVAGEPAGDVKYARQMGYDYIAVNPSFPPENYHKNPGCAGLKFYLVDPQWHPQVLSGYSRTIDTAQPVSNEAKEFYNLTMVWKSNDPFPYNLATGYNPAGDPAKISVMWDFQQQAVINEAVEKIVSLVKSYEDHGLSFTFGGYIINEPKLSGGFYRLDEEGDNIPVGLSYWTWADSGLVHGTITHEYATYSEGMAAFYKKLRSRLAREFEDAKWIVQPTELYSESNNNEWIYQIKDRADKDELTPDMLSQGSWQHTNFVDDVHNFSSGVNITKDRVGNSQAGDAEEYRNRLFAAKAGMNGAWYNWFGQFGGRGGMPDFQDIPDIYPRMKLIRCLPNWDNLNKVPLTERSWDGNIYQSITSYASGDIMYSRHPKTGKLFAVFLTLSGALTLNAGETVASAQRTDGYFIESGDGIADVSIVGNEIRLKSKANLGKGYIFTVASDGYQYTDGQMTAVTGSETDETSGFVASEITGNTNESSDTMLVEFASYQEEEEQNISAQTATSQQLRTASTWQPVVKRTQAQKRAGLSGGEGWQMITGISYAPSNPNIVYFITDTNQVWKSTNGGTSWHRKSGYPANGGASIVVHPTNPNIVYAAASVMGTWTLPEGSIEGIMRSTDGGDTWMLLYEAPFTRGYHWGNHIVFAGSNMYAAPDQHGILKSTNGTTWSRLNRSGGGYILSDKRLQNITVHPTDNTILFVSAHDGLYRVVDNGSSATQTKIGSGLPGGAVYQLQ